MRRWNCLLCCVGSSGLIRLQTAELKNLSDADVIAKVGTLFSVDHID